MLNSVVLAVVLVLGIGTQPVVHLVADKAAGTLCVVAAETACTPALFGAEVGDELPAASPRSGPRVTPAGDFPLQLMHSTHLGMDILAFHETDAWIMAIHATHLPARVQRLAGPPGERRITNGCIGVPVDFWNKHLADLPDGTRLTTLTETGAR